MLVLNEVVADGRVMRAATTLAEHYDIELLGWLRPEYKEKYSSKTFRTHPFKLHLVELWTARYLPKNILGYAARYIEILVRMIKIGSAIKPSIIHAHELDALLIGYLVKRITRSRLIYDAHELYRETGIWCNNKIINRIRGWLETNLMAHCDEIIACNKDRANIMYKEYGSPFLPKVIRNLPPFSEPAKNDRRLRDFVKGQNPNIDRIVLHIGGPIARGVDVVLPALAKVPKNIGLILLGHAHPQDLDNIQQLIQKYDIADRVFLCHPIPYSEYISYLSSADLGIVIYPNTSRNNYYCASNKIYEFAMCGLPVVSVDFPPCRDILERYRYGVYFAWNDPNDLGRAITQCLRDENQYQHMKKEALRAAAEENWDREQLHLVQIYEQIFVEKNPLPEL